MKLKLYAVLLFPLLLFCVALKAQSPSNSGTAMGKYRWRCCGLGLVTAQFCETAETFNIFTSADWFKHNRIE